MIHVFGGHTDDGLTGIGNMQPGDDVGQWGGHGPRKQATGTIGDHLPGDKDPRDLWSGTGGAVLSDVPGTSGADEDVARYRNLADAAGSRQGPDTDYSAGNAQFNNGFASRQGQVGALGLMRQQATGAAPSASSLSMFQGNDQVAQGQLALMAGARPGSAVAGQQAAGQGSMQMAGNIGHFGAARAGEISGAQSGLFGGYQDVRSGDLGAMRMSDARSQHLANTIMAQRGLNQQQRMGFEGLGFGVQNAQMDAHAAAQAAAQRRRTQQGNLDQQSRENADKVVDWGIGSLSAAGGAGASSYASSGK